MSFDPKTIVNVTGNADAGVASDGIVAGDIISYTDTGSFYLNALISGSIWKGMPDGKVLALAGPSGTGKTYILLSAIKGFLDENENAIVVLFESESALTKTMLEERGIDTSRIVIVPVTTVQEFRNQCVNVVEKYLATPKKDRPKMLIGLDSLGMLSTAKEMEDAISGSDKKDMTRAQLIRSVFRVITLKLGRANVPMIMTNHTYASMDAYTGPKMGGGDGLVYAASTIVFLTKAKEKDEKKNVIGAVIGCTLQKGRLTKEMSKAWISINFQTGLKRYFGLTNVAMEAGIWEKLPAGKVRLLTHAPSVVDIQGDLEYWITEDTYKRITKTIGLDTLGEKAKLWAINDKGKMVGEDGKTIGISKVRQNPSEYFTEDVWHELLIDDDVVSQLMSYQIFSVELPQKEVGMNPKEYFDKNVLDKIDQYLYDQFSYGAFKDEFDEEAEIDG